MAQAPPSALEEYMPTSLDDAGAKAKKLTIDAGKKVPSTEELDEMVSVREDLAGHHPYLDARALFRLRRRAVTCRAIRW